MKTAFVTATSTTTNLMSLVLMLMTTVLLISCGGEVEKTQASNAAIEQRPKVTYPEGATVIAVNGLNCPKCEAAVTMALKKVDGVEWAQATHVLGEVAFSGSAQEADVAAAITGAGYEVVAK